MDIQTLAQKMALEVGDEWTDTDVKNQYIEFCQEIIDDIITAGRWWHQNSKTDLALADATAEYTLPSTMSEVRDVRHKELFHRLALTTVEQLIRRGLDVDKAAQTVASGSDYYPTHWYPAGADASGYLKIGVWPVPTGAQTESIEVFGLLRPADLANDDTIPLPPEFINVAKVGIRALIKYNDGDYNGYQIMSQRYDDKLRLLNGRFHGAPRAGSRLFAKRGLRVTPQAPSAPGGD